MEIRLDYATVNFDAGTIDDTQISQALCGVNDLFWKRKGLSENAPYVSPFGLSYLNNSGFAPRPHRLQVSGVGCEKFALTLPRIVDVCHSNGGECSFSRLDFAFDVILSNADWKDFICSAFSSSVHCERRYKKFRIAGDGLAMTVYIGSRLSDYYFRIYNKSLENPHYEYREDGVVKEVPVGYSVIRYEIEVKRHVHILNGNRTVFDPSKYFYDYYSGSFELCELIRSLWLKWGDEVLLPSGFADAPLTLYTQSKNFVQFNNLEAIEEVKEKLHDEPRTFDRTIDYIVSHFGKYIPFLISDADMLHTCEHLCKQFCGFVPHYNLDNFVNTDFDELDDNAYTPFTPSQLEIDLNCEKEENSFACC